jgi:ribosomal protein L7/L12
VASSVQQQVEQIEKRIALIEVRLEQLFEHLNITPRGGGGAGGEGEGAGLDPNDDPEIQDLLAKGNALQATKRYQELTGASLDEAKQAIEQAQAED